MNRVIIFAALLFVSQITFADPPEKSGDIGCDRDFHGGGCRLAWNVMENYRAYHKVQWFDTAEDSWRDYDGRIVEYAYHTQKSTVPGGRLYRLLSCNDPDMQIGCVGSNVTWVLARPKSSDEMPDYLLNKDGYKMQISKDADLLTQIDQYNVYLLVQLVESIEDLASMPPMAKPNEPDPTTLVRAKPLTDDDLMYLDIYNNYEQLRTNAIQARSQ